MTQVGTVAAMYRHPVKSMRAEAMGHAELTWNGFEGDRRYAFVKTGNLTRFPWLTARDLPGLLRYAPYLANPDDPRRSPVRVRTPAGTDLALADDALRAELEDAYGSPLHLMHLSRGAPDSATVSVMGLATLRALGRTLGQELDPRRFRQNIWIETRGSVAAGDALAADSAEDGLPRVEDGWVGRLLIFGDPDSGARIRINRRDPRCVIVTLDPEEGVPAPSVLREIQQSHDNCVGLYASAEGLGVIRVGDPVYLT